MSLSISFSQNCQNPMGVIKVKRDSFPFLVPINTAASQGCSSASCFGMLLLPHISCHTPTTAARSHRATRTSPGHPPHPILQCPLAHHLSALDELSVLWASYRLPVLDTARHNSCSCSAERGTGLQSSRQLELWLHTCSAPEINKLLLQIKIFC